MKIVYFLAFTSIVSLPSYLVRCRNFSWCSSPIPFTLLEFLILTTFLAWIIWVVYSIRKNKDSAYKVIQRLRGPFILPLGLLVILGGLSLIFTSDLRGGLGIWKAYFIEAALFYLVVVDLSLRKGNYFWILNALIISGLLVSLASISSYLLIVMEIGIDEALSKRISGIYEFSNAVPLYLGPIIALSISVLVLKIKKIKKSPIFYLSSLGLLSMIAAILLSQSKGGIVGILVILATWFGYLTYSSLSLRYKKYFKYAAYLLVGIYFLINIFVYLNIDGFVPKGNFSKNSLENRYCIWQGTRDLLREKFATGAGLNGFHYDYNDYKTCLSNEYQYPHNILLTFWTEIGLIGVLVFLYVSYKYLELNSKGNSKWLSIGLLSALVYIFIHGLVDVPYFKNDLSVQFWLLAALITLNQKIEVNPKRLL